jgi:hypothetical protein
VKPLRGKRVGPRSLRAMGFSQWHFRPSPPCSTANHSRVMAGDSGVSRSGALPVVVKAPRPVRSFEEGLLGDRWPIRRCYSPSRVWPLAFGPWISNSNDAFPHIQCTVAEEPRQSATPLGLRPKGTRAVGALTLGRFGNPRSAASRSASHPTRLETRTKESNACASHWELVIPSGGMKVKGLFERALVAILNISSNSKRRSNGPSEPLT